MSQVEFVKFVVKDEYVQAMFKQAKEGLFDNERTVFARKFVTQTYNEIGEEETTKAINEWIKGKDLEIVVGDGETTYNELVEK
jgi:hypothetical protein